MCFLKKNCLNCAFCLRNLFYYYSGHYLSGIPGRWDKKIRSLTQEERTSIKDGKFDFIGEKLKELEEWHILYKQKKEENEKRIEQLPEIAKGIYLLQKLTKQPSILDNSIKQEELDELGIDAPPDDVPNEDFLSCWHGQWNEDKAPELINRRNELINKKCQSYFPFEKLDNKTLDACENERKEKLQTKISWKNNIIIPSIIGLVIAIIGGIAVYRYQKWDEEKSKKPPLLVQKIKIPQKIKSNIRSK